MCITKTYIIYIEIYMIYYILHYVQQDLTQDPLYTTSFVARGRF